ncbi:MAG: toll/interleukin-1 receptor domain-containing protein, partial [Bacteroidetes bacterium]|nr:toll/interleukin-1 receptor domain-containing protein [Bacteroidota bacterium]
MGKRDAFISHSSKDSQIAERVCAYFESNGLNCWIAPRDVTPGSNFDEEIIEGIENSKVFILLISKDSNMSDHVHRELHVAAENGNAIFPVRLEDIKPSNKLKYLLIGKHWTDAFQPHYSKGLSVLTGVIKDYIGKTTNTINGDKEINIADLRGKFPNNSIASIKLKDGKEEIIENF